MQFNKGISLTASFFTGQVWKGFNYFGTAVGHIIWRMSFQIPAFLKHWELFFLSSGTPPKLFYIKAKTGCRSHRPSSPVTGTAWSLCTFTKEKTTFPVWTPRLHPGQHVQQALMPAGTGEGKLLFRDHVDVMGKKRKMCAQGSWEEQCPITLHGDPMEICEGRGGGKKTLAL